MADLDADGHIDLLSGSWPGELFFFKGGPDRTFAAPVKLKDKLGKTINIGGGRRPDSQMILIAGDATFETIDGKQFIVYDGEKIEIPEGKQAGITGTASSLSVVDWDDDGDYDLLVGEIRGSVHLLTNEGTPQEYAFGPEQPVQAGGSDLIVGGDAGPQAADWDLDGDLDLLVGAGDGRVWLYTNTGARAAPTLAEGVELVGEPPTLNYGDPPSEVVRGSRAKVCVADWNGDGLPDLLVGDIAYQKPPPPDLTAEEQAEHERLRVRQDELMQRRQEVVDRLYGPDRQGLSKEEREAAEKDFRSVMDEFQEVSRKLPPTMETHGWVWLFARLPAEPRPAGGGP